MIQTSTTSKDVQAIVETLKNKSLSTLGQLTNELTRQALHFSPFYRDFINKILQNSSLSVVHDYNNSRLVHLELGEEASTLSRRRKNKIFTNIRDVSALPHELGHAVDFWFGHNNSMTSKILLSNGQTFLETFNTEFQEKKEVLYRVVMDEYIQVINSNINENAYAILSEYMPLYRKLLKIPEKTKEKKQKLLRKAIQEKLYKSGFMEIYLQLHLRRCTLSLNKKYSPILDALSSEYDFEGLCLVYHDFDYYQENKDNAAHEFFANCFRAEVTSELHLFSKLEKYMPNSFNAFQELFHIIYEHIQYDKRFTDLTIKQGVTAHA